jgi:hypothetical protein
MRRVLFAIQLSIFVLAVSILVHANTTAYADSKPPLKFEVYNPDKTTWANVDKDLKEYCGDDDGCRIKFLMQHELDRLDQVRCIEALIYMEQKDVSKNQHPGVYGWTKQSGGGNLSWITGTSAKYKIWGPWGWSFIFNYDHPYTGGKGVVYTNPYKFNFLTHPYVRLNVIIYDQ